MKKLRSAVPTLLFLTLWPIFLPAASRAAGESYRFRETFEGWPQDKVTSGRVSIATDALAFRVDFDAVEDPRPYDAILIDREARRLGLNFENKTYYDLQATTQSPATMARELEGPTSRLFQPASGVTDDLRASAFELEVSSGEEVTIAGHAATPTELRFDYEVKARIQRETVSGRVRATATFWMTDKATPPVPYLLEPTIRTGFEEIDTALALALAKLKGFPLRQELLIVSGFTNEQSSQERIDITIDSFSASTCDESCFEVPKGFVYEEPLLSTPGRMSPTLSNRTSRRLPAPSLAPTPLDEPEALLRTGQWEKAVTAYRSLPAEVAGSSEALLGLAQALHVGGAFQEAADTAQKAATAATDQGDRALALNRCGLSLAAQRKKKLYPEAADAFRRALEADPRLGSARLNLAELLLLQNDEAEARPLLEELVADESALALSVRAAALLRNPKNVEYPSLPAFKLVTLSGAAITPENLIGHVVLFDFWATWCQPCVQSIPELARLHEFSAGKPLQLISISADQDQETLNRFVDERGMDWPMVHDGPGGVQQRRFGVRNFPTYLLVDADGFIVARASGYSSSIADPVDRLVRQAKAMTKKLQSRDST